MLSLKVMYLCFLRYVITTNYKNLFLFQVSNGYSINQSKMMQIIKTMTETRDVLPPNNIFGLMPDYKLTSLSALYIPNSKQCILVLTVYTRSQNQKSVKCKKKTTTMISYVKLIFVNSQLVKSINRELDMGLCCQVAMNKI